MDILFVLSIAFVALVIVALRWSANSFAWINSPQGQQHLRWCGKASTCIAGTSSSGNGNE